MIDLQAARALAEAARADTSDGLDARERLADAVEELAAEVERLRSLRLAHPGDAVDPQVHTPGRVRAYLAATGWQVGAGGRVAEFWHRADSRDLQVLVPLIPTAPDYARALGMLAADLADRFGGGELQVLAEIEVTDA